MKQALTFCSLLILTSCVLHKKSALPSDIGNREFFDIEKFRKNSNGYEWEFVDSGKTTLQSWKPQQREFLEHITVASKFYTQVKAFSDKGIVLERGKLYEPGGFPIGLWEKFDSTGQLINVRDYDKESKVSYKEAIIYASLYYGLDQKDIKVESWQGNWYIECYRGPKKGRGCLINMQTRKREALTIEHRP